MERIMNLSRIWKGVWDVFPYFDRVPHWDDIYAEFLPRAAAANPGRELALIYGEFLARLGDGHTQFLCPQSLGLLPFSLQYTPEGYVVSAAPAGWERHLNQKVIAINGRPFDEFLAALFRYTYHVGNFVAGYGLHRTLPLLLEVKNQLVTTAGTVDFALVTAPVEKIAAPRATVSRPWQKICNGKLDIRRYGNILYIHLPDCQYAGAAAEIAQAYRESLRGVVLDLRDNIGGMTKIGGQVAELFLSGQFHGCQKWTRLSKGIDIACGSQFLGIPDPGEDARRCIATMEGRCFEEYRDTYGAPEHRALFHQPCVVLTSRRTVSAAEDTLAFFRSNHRATVLGEPTAGTTGTPYLLPLSWGSAQVCSVGYRQLDGTEFIGKGIQPDILVPTAIDDLQAGFDAQLEQALALLEQ